MMIYIVTGKSESGDDYGPWAFKNEPTDEELVDLAFWCDGDREYPDGPGDGGSYTFLSVDEREVYEDISAYFKQWNKT